MPVIALTGGIAAGKSLVAQVLQSHGLVVIDADQVARAVVEPGTPALQQIVERFGPGVVDASGHLDRQVLGAQIFRDSAARVDLNAIVHPAVWQESQRLFSAHLTEHPRVPLVYAIPLLVEGDRIDEFDLVVVVHAPAESRISRLVTERGLSEDDARARVESQASDDERLAAADIVIPADVSEESTRSEAAKLGRVLTEHWLDQLASAPAAFTAAGS
jgi:dephospho-CoA kinase